MIFSIPVLGVFAAYLVAEANGMHVSGVSGAMGAELGALLIAYVAIPNSIMKSRSECFTDLLTV